jgi:hypothetical protein
MELTVYRGGQPYMTIGNPYQLSSWAVASGLNPSEFSLDLAEVKTFKESELRDAHEANHQATIRGSEGTIVAAKYGRGGTAALSAEERAVFDEMNANLTKLKSLVSQVRAASTVEAVLAIQWEEPT